MMEAAGIKADAMACTALIRALGTEGLVDEAQAVFRRMVRGQCNPNLFLQIYLVRNKQELYQSCCQQLWGISIVENLHITRWACQPW